MHAVDIYLYIKTIKEEKPYYVVPSAATLLGRSNIIHLIIIFHPR